MDPNTHCKHFLKDILCIVDTHNSKTTGCMPTFYISRLLYYRRCLFLCQSWMQDMNGKLRLQAHITVFAISHLYVYNVLRHITWKLQVICGRSAYRTTAILSEAFFVWFRVALEIRLESYSSRNATVLWYNIVCVYCEPMYTLPFCMQLQLITKLTYCMTAYYTPDNSLTANEAYFNKNKVT